MAVTLERSFYCTGDACYLLDDTQPPSEPEPVSSNPLQSDLSLPPSSSLSSPSPPVPHTSSVLPLAQGPVSVLLPLPTSEESTASPSSPSFDLESYLYGACGVRWKVDEFDWVSGSRTVRATKLDEPGSLGVCPGTLRGSFPSVSPDGDEPRETGDRVFQAVTRAASPKKRGTNALNLKLPRYSSVIVKHSPLMFNEVLGMQLDPYRQTIEAKVLTALHNTASPLYPVTASCEDVLIPESIHHALPPNLLIKTDLGKHPSMDRFIFSSSFTYSRAKRLGHLLGDFLGRLHSAVSFVGENQPKPTVRLRRSLINSYVETTIQSVLGTIGVYLRMAGVEDHEGLLNVASERWLGREKSVFCKGNVSFGTLQVVSKDSSEDLDLEDDQVKVILCDWEFAGPGHPAGDIAQIGAYLHLASLSARTDERRRIAVVAFADDFYKTYYSHLYSIVVDDLDCYRQSLLVFHACEMITTSVWKHTLCCDCGDVLSCLHTRAMIHMASGLLRSVKEQKVDLVEAERVCGWTRYLWESLEELRTVAS